MKDKPRICTRCPKEIEEDFYFTIRGKEICRECSDLLASAGMDILEMDINDERPKGEKK